MTDNLLMHLLREAVSQSGSYDPEEALCHVEEGMTESQYQKAEAFLKWCHEGGNKFGHNIQEVYDRFLEARVKGN